jgi:HAD superfamily hydrolase (TIGR01509 family)
MAPHRAMVVMDIGDVLVRTVPKAHHRALAALAGRREDEVAGGIDAVAVAFERGELSEDDMVAAVRTGLGWAGLPAGEVERAWNEVIGAVDPVVAGPAARLAAAGRLVLASNTNPFHWRLIQVRLAAAGVDCPAYLSYEIGAMKPAPAFYTALAGGGRPVPAGSVFVDDKAENVAAAHDAGLTGWVHTDPAETAERLGALLSQARRPGAHGAAPR